jgi:hypothetical protein
MSTSATITDAGTLAAVAVKKEFVNFAVVVTLDSEGKIVPKSIRHTSSEKDIAYLESPNYGKTTVKHADGTSSVEDNPKEKEVIAFKQTVIKSKIGTLEGFAELVPDAEERLNIINKGIDSKFNQKIRTALIETNEDGTLAFQPVEPTYDATSLIQEAALRTNMSPTDKALKMLSGLTPDMVAAVMAQFAALNQAKSE